MISPGTPGEGCPYPRLEQSVRRGGAQSSHNFSRFLGYSLIVHPLEKFFGNFQNDRMTDDTCLPTAIVPARPLATARERFDTLARRFGDPMVRLFLLQHATVPGADPVTGAPVERPDTEMQFKAAAELMPYRYPKLKVSDVNHSGAPPGGTLNVQINFNAPPACTEVEVSAVTPLIDPLD